MLQFRTGGNISNFLNVHSELYETKHFQFDEKNVFTLRFERHRRFENNFLIVSAVVLAWGFVRANDQVKETSSRNFKNISWR